MPLIFYYVMLDKARKLPWQLYPQLLKYIMSSSYCDFPCFFIVCNPLVHVWEVEQPGNLFKPLDGYDFVILHHKETMMMPGLPHFLSLLDQQTSQLVNASTVLHDWASLTPDSDVPATTTLAYLHIPPPQQGDSANHRMHQKD